MKAFVIAGAVLLAGCTVANSPRMKPAGSSISSKSVQEIVGCLAPKMSKQGALAVANIPNGQRITSTVSVSGMKFVQSVATIEDVGPSRRVSVDELLSKAPPGSPIQAPFSECL